MLRILLMTVDQNRRGRSPMRQMTVPVGPAGDIQASEGQFQFEVSVSLPASDHQVVVGVRDEATGVLSLISRAAAVPSGSGPGSRRVHPTQYRGTVNSE